MSDYRIVRSDELYHYGVLGMKWGVRKERDSSVGANKSSKVKKKEERKEAKRVKKEQRARKIAQALWETDVNNNWSDAYNSAADKINSRLNAFNNDKRWDKPSFQNRNSKLYKQYVKEYCDMWNDVYTKELDSRFGKSHIDDGKQWCDRVPMFMNPEDLY